MLKLLIVTGLLLAQNDAGNQPAPNQVQPAANQAADAEAEKTAPAGDPDKPQEEPVAAAKPPGLGSLLAPMLLIFGLFYLMFMMPERKKRAKLKQQLEQLKTNDQVLTIGGILGTVSRVNKEADEVTLILDDSNNTRMKVVRSAIRQILTDEDKKK
ncbi:MAG: preprotein translocase subunit YajC [Pirellulaceae bacterium]